MAVEHGLKVVGLILISHTKPMTIQVQIRRADESDVSLEDCALFSTPMGEALDNSKLLKDPYVLEISSPGLGDVLKSKQDFETFKGFPIEVTFNKGEKSNLVKHGLLHNRSENHLIINIKGKMSKIPIENVITVRLTSPTV